MPELPEVQTVINTLNHSGLLNQSISDIKIYKPKLIKNTTVSQFSKFLISEKFMIIERIGKFLIFKMSHHKVLVVHLRMEGKMFYEPKDYSLPKNHLRIEFILNNKHALRYYDSRIFGTFDIYQGDAYLKAQQINKLGLDPLDKRFSWQYLKKQIYKCHKAIKTVLLDQTKLSGLGNIYVDEVLFLSKIHPLTKPNKLKDKDFQNIAKHSKQILLKAIKYGGTTVSSYKSDPNHAGKFQDMLLVHIRKGLPCYVCKTLIQKIKVNGRGTYFCPKCQKEIH